MADAAAIEAITRAIGAHVAWRNKLIQAIKTGFFEGEVESIRVDDNCAFGKWLQSRAISSDMKQGKPYEVVSRLHREFHQIAAQILVHVQQKDQAKAADLMNSEFNRKSETLIRALNKWKGELEAA
ncbi:MAG: CZB domain-containing protein [Mangrovicoccus sp.]